LQQIAGDDRAGQSTHARATMRLPCVARALVLGLALVCGGRADAETGVDSSASSSASFTTTTAGSDVLRPSQILTESASVNDYVIAIRRELHRNPELMWSERYTSSVIKRELHAMRITHKDVAAPGVVGIIGNGMAPVVLLRADMAALPLTEETDVGNFPEHLRSQKTGLMHACGHDGHVAMLLGAAKILKRNEHALNGTVYLVFQPAEEGGAGARAMLEAGLQTMQPKISTAFALHNWPYQETPSGTVGTKGGTIMAGSGSYEITVTGAGGHAAVPHKNVDVVGCGAAVVTALQTIVSRRVDPLDSVVISTTVFQAGGAASNVMADTALLAGTFRALSKKTFQWLHEVIEHVASSAAQTHGCTTDVNYAPTKDGVTREEYPPTVNDADAARFAMSMATAVLGATAENGLVREVSPVMPAEDFSFFAELVPSTMMWLGSYNESAGATWPLHSTKYLLDENVLHTGTAMHVGYAVAFFKNGGKFS
jgi:IAA-amino acid hydrolase